MPLDRSSLSLELSASSWKIARYDTFPHRLSVILTCPQQTKANKQAIESLAPQVKELAKRLCQPVHEGDVEERERRMVLEQLVHALYRRTTVESDTQRFLESLRRFFEIWPRWRSKGRLRVSLTTPRIRLDLTVWLRGFAM